MADLSYLDDLEKGLTKLRETLSVTFTRDETHRSALRLARRVSKTLRASVAAKGRSIGGINLTRELLFINNGVIGVRSGLKDGSLSPKEANQSLKAIRKTIRTLLSAIAQVRLREASEREKKTQAFDALPWEDINPLIDQGMKFDQMRQALAETNERLTDRQLRMRQHLEEDSRPLDYSNSQGARKEARLNEALDHLADITRAYEREFLPKIPRRVDDYQIIQLPLVVYTENPMSVVRLNRAKIKFHDLFPGYILERQTVMVTPKEVPPSVLASYIHEYSRDKGCTMVQPLQGTDSPTITSPYAPRLAFHWLMRHDTYTLLDTKVTSGQLAFSQKAQTLVTTDLSRMSRELVLGKLSDRYDPDSYEDRLFALDPESHHTFRVTRLPVLVEPKRESTLTWAPHLGFSITKVSDTQYILDNQMMLVVRRADYTSALVHSERFRMRVEQYLSTKHRKKLPVINPLDGMAIVTDLNEDCAYIWLMPESDYAWLKRPKFVRFGFPFSGGTFSSGDPVLDSRRKRFSRQLNKMETRLHKDQPRLFRLLRAFQGHVRDADQEIIILEKRIDELTREIKREEFRLANLPLTKPDRVLQFVPIERMRKQLGRLVGVAEERDATKKITTHRVIGEIEVLRAHRKEYQRVVTRVEKQLDGHRSALKATLIKTLRA